MKYGNERNEIVSERNYKVNAEYRCIGKACGTVNLDLAKHECTSRNEIDSALSLSRARL